MEIISSTTVRQIIKRGNAIPRCPYQIKLVHIDREFPIEASEPMVCGLFFESLCLGATAKGEAVIDLPRKKLTSKQERQNLINKKEGLPMIIGEKKIEQIRIEQQANVFAKIANELKMVIVKNYNTQIIVYKRHPEFPKFILKGTIDAVPIPLELSQPHPLTGSRSNICLFDLKLTGDLSRRTYDGTIWSEGATIDWFQIVFYCWLLKDLDFALNDEINPDNNLRKIFSPFILDVINSNNLLLYYWIFEYKNPRLGNTMKEFMYDQLKEKQMLESVRKAIIDIEFMESMGYPTEPTYELCINCPIKSCPSRDIIERL